jgi:dolichol-phosphate mannosyltransferase
MCGWDKLMRSNLHPVIANLLRSRVFRFLIGGGLSAGVNLGLMFFLVEFFGFKSHALRNVSNIISIELSVIFSFFVYRTFVWTGGDWNLRNLLFKLLPLYHASTGMVILIRIFLVFPFLDKLGVNYSINTLAGILLSASLNYFINDRLTFKHTDSSGELVEDLYAPEGLSPALENASPNCVKPESSRFIKVLSIVIPAYNEEEGISPTVYKITDILKQDDVDYEILVINDNSSDKTESVLKTLSEQDNRVRYLNNYYPNGFGFAVRCGLENFKGDAVIVSMADSSDPPENIIDYYHKLQEGYDCVFGSRFIPGGKVVDYPTHKLIVNRLANLFIQILFGLRYNDITNAFKGYRREVIVGISPLLSHHFNLTVEVPLKAIVRGYSYVTIPIGWENRATGISKLKLREMGSRYLFIVLSILAEKHLSRGDYVRLHEKDLAKKR